MRPSTRPFTGTVSARDALRHSSAHSPDAGALHRRAMPRGRVLMFMVWLLRSRWFRHDFRLGMKIDDFEAERIPAANLGVLRRIGVGVLNGCHPMREGLFRSGALAHRLEVPHLRKIGYAA